MENNNQEQLANAAKPPYLAYKTLRNFLDSLKPLGGAPAVIDRGVMPSSMSGQNQVYVIASLRFLKLIDDKGVPSKDFESLIHLEGKERIESWRKIFLEAYAPLFNGLDMKRATTKMVEAKMKEIGISGDTARKAILFYLGAAKDAGVEVSAYIKPYQNSRTNSQPKKRPAQINETENGATEKKNAPPPADDPSRKGHAMTKSVKLPEGGVVTLLVDGVNFLDLDGASKDFIFELSATMKNFAKQFEEAAQDDEEDYQDEGEDDA